MTDIAKIAGDGLTLSASDLWSKWGFNDGDMPDELGGLNYKRWDEVLEDLIRAHLVPMLEGVELQIWGTHHNPFRSATYGQEMPAKFAGVSVTIPWESVRAHLQEENDG